MFCLTWLQTELLATVHEEVGAGATRALLYGALMSHVENYMDRKHTIVVFLLGFLQNTYGRSSVSNMSSDWLMRLAG